jgi:hypothetical protein
MGYDIPLEQASMAPPRMRTFSGACIEERSVLKLFVWPHYAPNYDEGLAFAIAYSAEQARELIARANGGCRNSSLAASPRVHSLNELVAYQVCGGG